MADVLRIKRRVSGSPGAPATLANAELAYNEVDHTLYYGEGTGGAGGTASVIVPVAGPGLASSATPAMNGTATAGTATTWARGDHVHPTDTTRAPLANPVFTGDPQAPTPAAADNDTSIATTAFVKAQGYATSGSVPLPSSTVPAMDGAAAIGVGTTYARADHVHPTDSTRAPLASPIFSGDPQAPTPANADNDTSIATTAYVKGQRLDQFQPPAADVSWNSHKITSLLDPTNPQDAATKNYVDAAAQGIDAKASVRAATTTNLAALSAPQTVDGIALIAGDRVLVKDQTTQSANGIYVVQAAAWTRAPDIDVWLELVSAFTFVESGTINADSGWLCTVDAGGTLGTTAVTWTQFSGAGQLVAGNGLTKTGNQVDVVGTAGRIAVFADNVDIDAAYAGQTSIVTLGTVGTGVWNATVIGVPKGGTGAVSLTGYVKGNGVIAMTASPTIPTSDISGLGSMALQNATAVAITGGTIDGITFDMGTF